MTVNVWRRAGCEICVASSPSDSTILGGAAAECLRHCRTLAVGLDDVSIERWKGERPTLLVRSSRAACWNPLSCTRPLLEVPSLRRSLRFSVAFAVEVVLQLPLFALCFLRRPALLIGSPRRDSGREGKSSSSSSIERPFLLNTRPRSDEAVARRG